MDARLTKTSEVSIGNPDIGDLYVNDTDGQVDLLDGLEADAQEIVLGLSTFQGEWFLDLSAGVPYIQRLFQKGTSDVVIQEVLTKEILDPGTVARVTSLTLERLKGSRTGTVRFTAQKLSGDDVVGETDL